MDKDGSKMINPWDEAFKQVGIVFNQPYKHFPLFLQLIKNKKNAIVLDLACGTGRHTLRLAKAGFDVYSIDESPEGLRITSRLLSDAKLKAHLKRGDIFREKLPYKSEFFDAVLAIATIYHSTLWNINKLINEISRISKRGGLFFCTTSISVDYSKSINNGTNYIEIEEESYFPLDGREKWLFHHYFKKKELHKLLSKNFKNIKIFNDRENYYVISCNKK